MTGTKAAGCAGAAAGLDLRLDGTAFGTSARRHLHGRRSLSSQNVTHGNGWVAELDGRSAALEGLGYVLRGEFGLPERR